MSESHDFESVRASLKELGIEHAVTDDELRWIMGNPQEAVERARQMAEAANEITASVFAHFSRLMQEDA